MSAQPVSKDNYAVDRAAGDQFLATFPEIAVVARAFMGRAVRHLADEAGIRQFLDIGTGLPTFNSTHEVAQQVAPESRIVYVDNDPVVLLHAHALLKSSPQGATDYLEADLREPGKIIAGAGKTLDFAQPVAVMLVGIMGHITDDGEALSIVRALMNSVPSGSYLVLSDGTNVVHGEQGQAAQDDYNDSGAEPYSLRSPEQIARFLRRPGPGGTRRGLLSTVAALRQFPGRNRARRGRRIWRGRPETLKPTPTSCAALARTLERPHGRLPGDPVRERIEKHIRDRRTR